MTHTNPIHVDYIRTSTSGQSGNDQQEALEANFPNPADETIWDTDTDGTSRPMQREFLIKRIKTIRKTAPKAPITFHSTHVDRFLKAPDISTTVSTYKWMRANNFQLSLVEPIPFIKVRGVSHAELMETIYKLNWERLVSLGQGKSTSRRPFKITYAPLYKILSKAADDLITIRNLRLALNNKSFRWFALAARTFGVFNPLQHLITSKGNRTHRDPGGWGKDAKHYSVFKAVSKLQRDGTSQRHISHILNNKLHLTTLRNEPFNRDSVRSLLNSPGYLAYTAPIHIPNTVRPFRRKQLPSGLYLKQSQALEALALDHNLLLHNATGSGKTRVAIDHHRACLTKDPDHITVFVAPNKGLIYKLHSIHGGITLAGNRNSSTNRANLRLLESGKDGGLVFLTPDKLQMQSFERFPIQEAIRRRPSILLVVDEADCILEDANYRKPYLDFRESVLGIRPTQVLCMTASAAPGFVRNHIRAQVLPDGSPWTVIKGNVDRPNLFYQHHRCQHATVRCVFMERIIHKHLRRGHQGVVHLARICDVNRFHAFLENLDCRVGLYHSQRSDPQNQQVIDDYEAGNIDVVVATSGFGRGLDLPTDFEIVGHIPTNGSMLSQYTGRAGRKGKPAFCYWVSAPADKHFLRYARRGIKESDLPLPAKKHLVRQTKIIYNAAHQARSHCLRRILLEPQQSVPIRDDPRACCLACAQRADPI